MEQPPLRLEELFFPLQSVRANEHHDLTGVRDGTRIKISHHLERVAGQAGKYVVNVTIESDDETSTNAPYSFSFAAYAVVAIDEISAKLADERERKETLAYLGGAQMVVGAIRERLADLTSRAPWGRFLMNVVNIVPTKPEATT